jgi:CxxC motif-containing protein (DUF1111 family)
MRLLEIPARAPPSPRGVQLFHDVKCDVCHVPTLHTRADYPIAALADIDAPVFTDFLLHERGAAYADGVVEGQARPGQWRTAPLIGLRFMTQFLHDGSAPTVLDAILSHGQPDAESRTAYDAFTALSAADQELLVGYVSSL